MLNIGLAINYLLHRIKANNRHGIHSPFVYKLIDTVIYDYSYQKVYREIQDNIKKQNTDAAFTKPPKPKVLQLLYRLITYFKPAIIIRQGVNYGIGAVLNATAPKSKIYSFTAEDELKDILKMKSNIDLIILNGDSQKQFELCLPYIYDDTVIILTNICQNKTAKQTWANIKANPNVRVTINLFYIGLVFFKPGMSKEDFKVKY